MKDNTLYYRRTETDRRIIITWKPFCAYGIYLLMVVFIICAEISYSASSPTLAAIGSWLTLLSLLLLLAHTAAYFFTCLKIKKEIREATEQGLVSVGGNRQSFRNPQKIYIKKPYAVSGSAENADAGDEEETE